MKQLRPYQQRAIKSVTTELQNGISRPLLTMSMGLGKTFTAVKIEEEVKSKKTFWLTDDERLLEQSAMAFINDKFEKNVADEIEKVGFIDYCRQGGVLPDSGYKMSIVKADLFDTSGDIVFISAQTLWRRLHLLDPEMCDVMIIDEAHCFGSKRFYEGLSHFNTRLRLGLSATPYREDGMLMGDLFEKIVFDYGMRDGIRDGYLCELDAIRIKTNISLDKVHTLGGDFNQQELSNEINTPSRNFLIADSYLKYAKDRQAIGFCTNIQHAIDLAEAFQMKGINAVAASSDEERTGDKNKTIKAYRNGDIDVLMQVNLVSKGFDHPNTGCSIAAAPTKSIVRYLQGPAGRCGRLKTPEYVQKFGQNAVILDIVDLTSRHNIVNAWELDRKLPPEERTFITDEKRQKLLESRMPKSAAKIEIERKEDEFVKLIQLPKITISKSLKMSEPATEAQLQVIQRWGYDTESTRYTKNQISEIFGKQPAFKNDIEFLKRHNYDVSGFVSVAEAQAAMKEIMSRKK